MAATNGEFKVEFIDSGDILKVLDTLTDDNYVKSKIIVKALKKGGEILQENTVSIMKSKLGSTVTSSRRGRPMEEGVRVIVDKNYYDVIVSIMKDYRLKWFEKGTDDRFTKGKITGRARITKGDGTRERNVRDNNKLYRGSIEGKHFFAQARNETTGIDKAVFASLSESINRVFKK